MTASPLAMPARRRGAPVPACASCFGSGRTLSTRSSVSGHEIAEYVDCPNCTGRVPVRYVTSHLAAARWAEDHDEDLNRYDDDGDDQ